MDINVITSTQNTRIKRLLVLQQKSSERRRTGLFVVEGRRELAHCIEAGLTVEEVYYCPQLCPDLSMCHPLHSPIITEVTPAVYERIAYRGSTEGVVAVVRQRSLSLTDIPLVGDASQRHNSALPVVGDASQRHSPALPVVGDASQRHNSALPVVGDASQRYSPAFPVVGDASQRHNPLIVVLESVEKPGNLGAVLRSADAAGATAVIVCDPLTDLYNPNLIRASLGAFFSVPVVACTSEECIRFLKAHGIAILTAQLQDSSLYYATDMRRPVAIVMGTEADGLTPQWRQAADEHIRIPMLGRLDSLNVSVSAAILLFEAVRQRQ